MCSSDLGPGADFADLAREGATYGGRVYAGSASANSPYKILYAPTYMVLAHEDIDAVGFTLRTLSLSGDAEVKFNDQRPEHLDLFNVRALVLPSGVQPASALGATLVLEGDKPPLELCLELDEPRLPLGVVERKALLDLRVEARKVEFVELLQVAPIRGIHVVEPPHQFVGDLFAEAIVECFRQSRRDRHRDIPRE